MNKFMLSLATLLLFSFSGFAQTTTDPNAGTQGTQSSSPAMQQQQPGASDQSGMNGANSNNSEKKIKGCVAQQNGQYVLETKHGKTIALSGTDVSAHVGHTVALHGTWAGTSASASTQTSTGNAESSGQSFNVTKVDMISDNCSMKGNMSSGSNSNTPQQ